MALLTGHETLISRQGTTADILNPHLLNIELPSTYRQKKMLTGCPQAAHEAGPECTRPSLRLCKWLVNGYWRVGSLLCGGVPALSCLCSYTQSSSPVP